MNLRKILLPSILVLSSIATATFADSPWKSWKGKGSPEHFDKMWVQLISEPIDTVDGSFAVDGLVAGDGMHFFKNILGLSDDEIEESRMTAVEFFAERFGLDVSDPGLLFTGFESIPETNYHVAWSSGERVPSEGWRLDDGGWILMVTDPEGVDLGGEFEGTHVPAGTFFVTGTYKINRTWKRRGHIKELPPRIVHYRAGGPVTAKADGSMHVACDLISDEFGEGKGIGTAIPFIMPDGKLSLNMRMVVTFPPFGHLIEDQLEN